MADALCVWHNNAKRFPSVQSLKQFYFLRAFAALCLFHFLLIMFLLKEKLSFYYGVVVVFLSGLLASLYVQWRAHQAIRCIYLLPDRFAIATYATKTLQWFPKRFAVPHFNNHKLCIHYIDRYFCFEPEQWQNYDQLVRYFSE